MIFNFLLHLSELVRVNYALDRDKDRVAVFIDNLFLLRLDSTTTMDEVIEVKLVNLALMTLGEVVESTIVVA